MAIQSASIETPGRAVSFMVCTISSATALAFSITASSSWLRTILTRIMTSCADSNFAAGNAFTTGSRVA